MNKNLFLAGLLVLCLAVIGAQDASQQIPFEKQGMVGIQLSQKDGQYFIAHVFQNSPAESAGLRPGDVILRVADVDVGSLSLEEVVNLFRGEPDTLAKISVRRGTENVATLNVNRTTAQFLMENSPDYKMMSSSFPPGLEPIEVETPMPDSEKVKLWLDYYERVYGMRLLPIDAKFGEKLGALFTEGLLVIDVQVGKPAYKAGLSKWDLIHRIEEKSPLEIFRTQKPPDESTGPKPLSITLMGLTGETPFKL